MNPSLSAFVFNLTGMVVLIKTDNFSQVVESVARLLCSHDFQQRFETVIFSALVLAMVTALFATVYQKAMRTRHFHPHRSHQPTAGRCPVTRKNVHMFAVQAVRAMIGVAIALDFAAAVLTAEIFPLANKR